MVTLLSKEWHSYFWEDIFIILTENSGHDDIERLSCNSCLGRLTKSCKRCDIYFSMPFIIYISLLKCLQHTLIYLYIFFFGEGVLGGGVSSPPEFYCLFYMTVTFLRHQQMYAWIAVRRLTFAGFLTDLFLVVSGDSRKTIKNRISQTNTKSKCFKEHFSAADLKCHRYIRLVVKHSLFFKFLGIFFRTYAPIVYLPVLGALMRRRFLGNVGRRMAGSRLL